MAVELQAESTEDVSVVLSPEQPSTSSQPAHQPSNEKLDKAQVRAATLRAAEQGMDPFDLVIGDLNQGLTPVQQKIAQAETPVDVPEKFKKPNGEADVEKLKASTKQLNEGIQAKEEVQKSIDDYLVAEKRFKSLPNLQKLKAEAPASVLAPAPAPATLSMEELKAKIAVDLQRDAPGTVLDLVEIAVQERLKREIGPLKADAEERKIERQDRQLRDNLSQLAQKDPRILHPVVFDAINAKLEEKPEFWNLQNPHKAAWLEVKDEMRLGEVPNGASAQPSRLPSPILGGGTPSPAPSSSDQALSADTLLQAASRIGRDPRDVRYDPNQAANMRRAAKELFDKLDRQARR